MLNTTLGQLMVNEALPPDLRDYNRKLDKKTIAGVLQQVAERYPDKYREIAKKLSDVGRDAATATGGFSFGLRSLRQSEAAKQMRKTLTQKLRGIYASGAPRDEKDKQILLAVGEYQKKLSDDVMAEALAANNPLALQALSGARGNKMNVNSLLGADLLYTDHRGKVLPVPVLNSYSMGLKPYEYFAGAFGARKGVFDLKCLGGDTLVVMADWSTRKIKDIRVGDHVMGSDTSGRLRPVKVLNVFDNGKRTCYNWRFRVGSCRKRFAEVVATADHKILAQVRAGRPGSTYAYRSNYTPLPLPLSTARLQKKATKNEFVAWPARGEVNSENGVYEHRALLLGLLLGDGYTPEKTGHTLSCADQSLIDDTATYLASMNLKLNPPSEGYSHRLVEIVKSKQKMTVSNGRNAFAGTGNPVRQWLHDIGCTGKLAHEKQLPAVIWQWDRTSICQLIGGLIATDGTIEVRDDGCTVKFKLTSLQIVSQVQRLLELRLGIWCTPIRRIPVETIPLGNYDQWEITFSHPEAIRRFVELVYVPGVKHQQLQDGLRQLSAEPRSAEIGFKIQSREPVGEIQTFDIEVDHPDHLFLLDNGLVVSNSATQDAGFFAKQLVQATHRLLVSATDDENPYDESSPRGYSVPTNDPDNAGSLLAADIGGYARNTVLTPKIMRELRDAGHDEILIRSPIVGGPADGGVYARDVGVREKGDIAPIGDYVGIAGAQALAEPVTQAQISSKHCLAGDTLVRMADFSTKQIRDIVVGDWVLGADTDGNTFPVRVVQVYSNGLRQCYVTTFRQAFIQDATADRSLTSTLCHKFLGIKNCSGQKEEKFNNVRRMLPIGVTGKRVAAAAPYGFNDEHADLINEPMAVLIGALLGDGCYTESVHGCYFTCFDPLLIQHLEDAIQGSNIKFTQLSGHDGNYYRVSQIDELGTPQDTDGRFTGSYRNPVMRWLDDRNMLHKYAHEKRLPPEVDTWDNQSVAALLGALFATDGSVYPVEQGGKWGINFGSTSEEMRDQVRRLLELRFGIYGSISMNSYGGRKRPMYYLDINHAAMRLRFMDCIPLYGVKRHTIADLEAEFPASNTHQHMKFVRRRQKNVGLLPTYDLQVDHPDHLFVLANGLIVSNSGGVAGAGAGAISGFKAINQLVQVPKVFQGGATHAQLDGKVTHIREAPQGGHFITVGGQEHYAPQGTTANVKIGDTVEAGDVLTDGTPNPAEIVRHKGIGEGRRYFVDAFRKSLTDASTYGNRRNIELLSRGLINHVRLNEEVGDFSPDDVVPYQLLEANWEPRKGHSSGNPAHLVGQYLERPVLHYTVGTRIQPSMLPRLQKYNVNNVVAHKNPPPFQPEMIRGMANVHNDPDWLVRMLGSYQKNSLLDAVHRGDSSDTAGSSYVPALVHGTGFGVEGLTKGWKPK